MFSMGNENFFRRAVAGGMHSASWGFFPFLALLEEAVYISFQSFHYFSKIQFVFKLEVVAVLAEAACCYLWGFHSLILFF